MFGYKKFGNQSKFKKDPIKHLFEIYVKVSKNKKYEEPARNWFKKLEEGDKEALSMWEKFRKISLKDFMEIYKRLDIGFDIYSGESMYNQDIKKSVDLLNEKKLLKESENALIVDLEKFNLGVSLIQKSDGSTLYSTRDIASAISRYEKYHFDRMIYEVGQEQKLHLKQVFKILELMGYNWAKECVHVNHGLYLGKDGKRLSTRKGKTFFMEKLLEETEKLAEKEIKKRFPKLKKIEIEKRAKIIAIAAIFYGDLKNNRINNLIFDIQKFVSFEGDTGPYLLYSYARAGSIIRKVKKRKKISINELELKEIELVKKLSQFPGVVISSYKTLNPSLIANYSYQLSQIFNEFYHTCPVIGSEKEEFRLALVESFMYTLKNALNLLGIKTIEKM